MEITDVRIRRIDDEGKMKAVASITFDNEFVIHDIKIVSGKNGMFVAMPSKKIGQSYKDVAHPLSPETRSKISDAIFNRYEEVLAEKEREVIPTDEEEILEGGEIVRPDGGAVRLGGESVRTDGEADVT